MSMLSRPNKVTDEVSLSYAVFELENIQTMCSNNLTVCQVYSLSSKGTNYLVHEEYAKGNS
jgi:hypothetical protein